MKTRFVLGVLALGLFTPQGSAQTPDLYDPTSYRSIYLTFSQPNYWQLLLQNYTPEINIPATMVVDNITYNNVGVRFRGNTSYTQLPPGSEKKSFNIELDSFVPGQDIYGYDHINLNNGFHDPTFLREFIGYYVCRTYGLAPKANFVKLYLNNIYWGVYINVQQPNKDMMKEWFRSNDGNRYRGFPTTGTFGGGRCAYTWLGATPALYLAAYQAKQGDGTDLMQLCNVLNNTPASQLQAALPTIFSYDQFYRYAACMNVMTNTDSYIGSGKDHFAYHDEIYGAFHVFPFDLNETLAGNATLSVTQNNTVATYPAYAKTLQFADWRERYFAHYRTIFEDTMNWAHLGPIITYYHNLIAADVAADTKKIYTTQAFTDNLTLPISTPQGPVPGLRTLIEARYNFLRALPQFQVVRPSLSNLAHAPASPTPADSVTVTVQAANASAVRLFSRKAGPFVAAPMFDDGAHGDGQPNDGLWGVIFPPQTPGTLMDYYVEAVTSAGTPSYLPKTAELRAPFFVVNWPQGNSPIKLNEFVAQNINGIVDENNQHEDWLELYNSSNQPVVVGGMYLTDNPVQPTKWQIPANTTIAGGGTLLIWCDEDGTQGPMHASFKLATSGEEISLFATDGQTQLDRFAYGQQTPDIATGRLVDGTTPWVSLLVPSPRLANQPASMGTRKYSAQLLSSHTIDLGLNGAPRINTTVTLAGQGITPSAPVATFVAAAGDHLNLSILGLGQRVLLLDVATMGLLTTLTADGQGRFTLPIAIPNDQSMVGLAVYLQSFASSAGGLSASNGLELLFGN